MKVKHNRIKEIAESKGITQKVLAERLGVTIYTVRHFYHTPLLSITTAEKFAKALGCNTWEVFCTDKEILNLLPFKSVMEFYNSHKFRV